MESNRLFKYLGGCGFGFDIHLKHLVLVFGTYYYFYHRLILTRYILWTKI